MRFDRVDLMRGLGILANSFPIAFRLVLRKISIVYYYVML